MHPVYNELKSSPASQKPTMLLLVENEVLIRRGTARYLRLRGFEVLEATSVDEAEGFFTAGVAIDIVFSDIKLGPRDGVELARWIGSHFPQVPVILTSGVPSPLPAAEDCSHIVEFIEKPYSPLAVEQRIQALVPRRDAVGP
jgi:DNA-binding NtrC family response regulator